MNTGNFATAGVKVTGTKTIDNKTYTLTSQMSANGHTSEATYGTETNTAAIETNTTLPRLYISKDTGLVSTNLSATSTTISGGKSDGTVFELNIDDGLMFGTNNYRGTYMNSSVFRAQQNDSSSTYG